MDKNLGQFMNFITRCVYPCIPREKVLGVSKQFVPGYRRNALQTGRDQPRYFSRYPSNPF